MRIQTAEGDRSWPSRSPRRESNPRLGDGRRRADWEGRAPPLRSGAKAGAGRSDALKTQLATAGARAPAVALRPRHGRSASPSQARIQLSRSFVSSVTVPYCPLWGHRGIFPKTHAKGCCVIGRACRPARGRLPRRLSLNQMARFTASLSAVSLSVRRRNGARALDDRDGAREPVLRAHSLARLGGLGAHIDVAQRLPERGREGLRGQCAMR